MQVCGKSAVVGERILASKTQGHSSREIASILGLRSIASFHCPFSPPLVPLAASETFRRLSSQRLFFFAFRPLVDTENWQCRTVGALQVHKTLWRLALPILPQAPTEQKDFAFPGKEPRPTRFWPAPFFLLTNGGSRVSDRDNCRSLVCPSIGTLVGRAMAGDPRAQSHSFLQAGKWLPNPKRRFPRPL